MYFKKILAILLILFVSQGVSFAENKTDLIFILVDEHLKNNQFETALEELDKIKELHHDSLYYMFQGYAFFGLEKHGQAKESLINSIQHNPMNAEAWNLLGMTNFALKRIHDAESAFLNALAVPGYEDNYKSSLNLAFAFYAQNNIEKALEYANFSIELKPDFQEAINFTQILNSEKNHPSIIITPEAKNPVMNIQDIKIFDDQKNSKLNSEISDIRLIVHAWIKAWQSQNPDVFFAFYSKEFNSEKGEKFHTWSKLYKPHLVNPKYINTNISNLTIVLENEDTAHATFNQKYESNTFKFYRKKTLTLKKENNFWKILYERNVADL